MSKKTNEPDMGRITIGNQVQILADEMKGVKTRLNQLECSHNHIVFLEPDVTHFTYHYCTECVDCGKYIKTYNDKKSWQKDLIEYTKSDWEKEVAQHEACMALLEKELKEIN